MKGRSIIEEKGKKVFKNDKQTEARALGYLILCLKESKEVSLKEARHLLSGLRKPRCKKKKLEKGEINLLLRKWQKEGLIIIKNGKIKLNLIR